MYTILYLVITYMCYQYFAVYNTNTIARILSSHFIFQFYNGIFFTQSDYSTKSVCTN